MRRFAPPELAALIRIGRLYAPAEEDLSNFGERGTWQAGAEVLDLALLCWWAGERMQGDMLLSRAQRWLQAPESEGRPWGDPPLLYEARHRHARALAAHATGQDAPRLWREAAGAIEAWSAACDPPGDERIAFDAALCRWMSGARAGDAGLTGPEAALAEALDGGVPPPLAFGRYLLMTQSRAREQAPGFTEATLYFAAFGPLLPPSERALCLLADYVLLPALTLPPGLLERGWRDASTARATVRRDAFAWFDRAAPAFALERDPDAIAQPTPVPELATWTRHPDFSLELDWQAPAGEAVAWIEVRGDAAGRAAALMAEAVAGRVAPAQAQALAALLTVPPNTAAGGNGELRWTLLATLLAAPELADRDTATALIAAGLEDPDWRVRMAALWGVGRMRLGALRDAAARVRLPPPECAGLNGEDRRALLALRECAWHRAGGSGEEEGINNRKVTLMAEIDGVFDGFPDTPRSRNEALLMALLRRSGLPADLVPRAWKTWWQPAGRVLALVQPRSS